MQSASLPHIIPESSKSIYNMNIRRIPSTIIPVAANQPTIIKKKRNIKKKHFNIEQKNTNNYFDKILCVVIILFIFTLVLSSKKLFSS